MRFVKLILCSVFLFVSIVEAKEKIPFTIKSINSAQAGFIELIGPGQISISNKITSYNGGQFILARNITTVTKVRGVPKGCILTYSSGKYSESISVKSQSCKEIIEVIGAAVET